jgi:hypothetical protein
MHIHAVRRSSHLHDDHEDHSHNHRRLGDNGLNIGACGTPDLTPEERAENSAAMMKWETDQGPPGAHQTASYVIQTWIHVLAKDAITGQLSSIKIRDIVADLNQFFTGSAFRFELAGSHTRINESWYDCGMGDTTNEAEVEFKPALRQGGMETLNIWVRRAQVQVPHAHI